MRAVVQRVSRASVRVDGEAVAEIWVGLLVLLGVRRGDTEADARYVAEKVATLRIFADDEGRMNRSVRDIGGEAIVVSQFTLHGDVRRGRRPSFGDAAAPSEAEPLVRRTVEALRDLGVGTQEGVFGASMEIELVNEGPVTIVFDTRPERGGESSLC